MEIKFSRIYVIAHLFAVFALFVSPFIFFNVYADDTQNVWKVTIPHGVSENEDSGSFLPNELPVHVGDTIVWENNDEFNHSIVSGLPQKPEFAGQFFDLGHIQPGNTISFVLTNSEYSAFYYFCEIHPWMTGKIFISDLESAQPETENPIQIEKKEYDYGDEINISGKVHSDFAGSEYTTLIYNQYNELVKSYDGLFDLDGAYEQSIEAQGNTWDAEGTYQVKMVYALPSKVAKSSFEFSTKFIPVESTLVIPEWIKNVGEYWCDDKIDDTEFVNAVQYLIKNDVIELKDEKSEIVSSEDVPEWVKNSACWWSQDKIPDPDFVFGIEYLVNIGTIRV